MNSVHLSQPDGLGAVVSANNVLEAHGVQHLAHETIAATEVEQDRRVPL